MWRSETRSVVDEFIRRAAEENRLFYLAHPDYKFKPRPSKDIKKRNTAAKMAATTNNADDSTTE